MRQFFKQLPKQHKIILTSVLFLLIYLALSPTKDTVTSPAITKTPSTLNSDTFAVEIEKTDTQAKQQPIVTAKATQESQTQLKQAQLAQPQREQTQLEQAQLEIGKHYALDIDLSELDNTAPLAQPVQPLKWRDVKVKNGDNLALIFKRAGFSAQTLHKITSLGKPTKILKKIHPGDTLSFGTLNDDKDKKLQQLRYIYSPVSTLVVSLNEQGKYQADTETKEVEIREQFASAQIDSNFWNAGVDAGLKENQIMNLANIFGWDIDFANDIRQGDQFSVLYEARFIDGEYVGVGKILAAEFYNQGEAYQAVRYKDGEYYTPKGRSMRKAFLRAPVNFKYVSSNFKPRRFHPVLKRWKAHRGVDYAAKTGTPVVAAGSGKVIRSAYNKYNGHHVFIQHPGGIVTKYLHFSKRKVKNGARVKQGQLIGLVGSTGLSSAPHLHFEFIVNGVHRNPRTVKLPKAKPIAKKEKATFLALANKQMHRLESSRRVMLAYSTPNKSENKTQRYSD